MEKSWCKRYVRLRQERVYRVVRVSAKRNKSNTRLSDFYLHNNRSIIGSEEEKNTKAFVSGINNFFIRICGNFYIFCEFFDLDPTEEKSEDKFQYFQQLTQTINQFSMEELAQMIGAGMRLLDDN